MSAQITKQQVAGSPKHCTESRLLNPGIVLQALFVGRKRLLVFMDRSLARFDNVKGKLCALFLSFSSSETMLQPCPKKIALAP